MVTGIWKLRIALLLSFKKLSVTQLLRRVLLFGLLSLGLVALAALPLFQVLSFAEALQQDSVSITIVAIVVWAVAFFAGHNYLSPRYFSLFSEPSLRARAKILVSSVLSWTHILVFAWLGVILAMRWYLFGFDQLNILSFVMTFLLFFIGTNLFALMGSMLDTQRNHRVMSLTAWLFGLAVTPILLLVLWQLFTPGNSSLIADAANIVQWLPPGISQGVVEAVSAGDVSLVILSVAGVTLFIALGIISWFALARRSMNSIEKPEESLLTEINTGWPGRLTASPWGVIGARSLVYWRRDPRYLVSLLAVPIAPLFILGALSISNVDVTLLLLVPVPVMLLLLGWFVHNDVAADSTAVWAHVASGTSGKADRIGRLVPVFAIGVPLLAVGSSLSVMLHGDWHILPAVLGLNIAALCISAGVSSASSSQFPYASTRPWESPFSQPAGTGAGSSPGIVQSVTMIISLALLLFVALLVTPAVSEPTFVHSLIALFASVVIGVGVLILGFSMGSKAFDQGAPELLAITQAID